MTPRAPVTVELLGLARYLAGRDEVEIVGSTPCSARSLIEAIALQAPALLGDVIDANMILVGGHVLAASGEAPLAMDDQIEPGAQLMLFSLWAGG